MRLLKSFLPVIAVLSLACSDETGPSPAESVASVAIDPGVRELIVGQPLNLVAVVKGSSGRTLTRAVTWSSNNAGVATVSAAGLVQAVGEGTVTITASVGGKSDAVAIVVSAAGTGQVATIQLNYIDVDLQEGHAFTFVATPKDAFGNEVAGRVAQWTSSAPAIAAVNPIGVGRVLPIKPGLTTITARIDGKTATAEVEVYAAYPYELVYEMAGTGGLALLQLDINDPNAMPSVLLPGPIGGARVSPDGARIAYVVGGAGGHSTIWVANRNGSNGRAVTTGLGTHDQPSWSPDGARLVYRRWHWQAGEGSDIWTVNTTGPVAPVNLTGDTPNAESEPAWSNELAGGSRIAYVRTVQGQGSIWTMRADGADKTQITAGPFDAEPAWSPAGDLIVFQRSGIATFGDLYLTDASGGDPWILASLPQIQRAPTWSPDGALIAFASGHEGGVEQIYTVAPAGNRLARRTSGPGTHGRPSWVLK